MVAWDAGILTNPSDEVHHKNENKQDNRLSNLEIVTKATHTSIHTKGKGSRRKALRDCTFGGCGKTTSGKYGLCTYHYRLQWARVKAGRIKNIYENPDLLAKPAERSDAEQTPPGNLGVTAWEERKIG